MAYHDKGAKSKKSTRLVNDTDVKLHLYYVSSNGNPYFRKTLHPRPSNENAASVDVSPETRVATVNDGVELTDGHTFIEEFDSNNTFGMLRLWDDKNRLVVALDTDLLIDNREITITCSGDGNFALKLTGRLCDEKLPVVALDRDELFDNGEIVITVSDDCIFRSQEKQSKDAENSATRELGNLNMFGKFKQYASNRISSFRTPRPNGG